MVDTAEVVLNIFVSALAVISGIVVGMWVSKRSEERIVDAMMRLPIGGRAIYGP